MAHLSRSQVSGRQTSLLPLLPFALHSFSSGNPFGILKLSSFMPYFHDILHKVGLLTQKAEYAFFTSNSVATRVQSSILVLSFTYKNTSSCSLTHICDESAVDLSIRSQSWSSPSTPTASVHSLNLDAMILASILLAIIHLTILKNAMIHLTILRHCISGKCAIYVRKEDCT